MSERSQTVTGLGAEIVFAALPLLVVLMVLAQAEHAWRLFMAPEWSFGAAILFGQSLVKFVSGLARGGRVAKGPLTLVLALLIVFGLVPSLFVLYIVLQTAEANLDPSRWLQFLQVGLFCGAGATYLMLGTIGESWAHD